MDGRQIHILARALTYAIAVIDALPPQMRALSDQDDMKAMLDDMIARDSDLARYQGIAIEHVKAITDA